LIRSWWIKKENEAIKRENLRKALYSRIIADAQSFDPTRVQLTLEEMRPRQANAVEEEVQHLAAWARGELTTEGYWNFEDIAFTQEEAEKVRATIREEDYIPQKTVFDTEERL